MAWVPVGNVKGPQGDTGAAGTTTWAGITDKPAYIGAGTTAALARAAIGAGTSDLAIGTSGSTAMAGNKTAADLGGLQLGSTGSTAAAGNHTHTAAQVGAADVEGAAVGIWLGATGSLPGTGTTGYVYFTY
jgi:hypothetical protein